MLPYHALQVAYALLSLALVGLLWWAAGRVQFASWLPLRAALTIGLVGVLGILLHVVLSALVNPIASLFIVVALVFYAGGIWVPALLAASALRASSRSRVTPGERAAALLLSIGAFSIALWAMLVEPNRLQVREERIGLSSWRPDTAPLRVLHLSDLQTVGACERERRALATIAELAPDLIVITGDYVAGPFFDTRPAEAAARAFLERLCPIAPTFVVAGHSEDEEVRQRIFAGLQLDYLEDRAQSLDFGGGRKLRIVGLDPFRPDLRVPAQARAAGEALVVVTHSPDDTTRLAGMRVDLHLAGHTHGGQIVVPFFGPPITLTALPRRYARGLFQMGDHPMNVCAGLGMEGNHAPRVRLFCPPEICLLTLAGATEVPEGGSH